MKGDTASSARGTAFARLQAFPDKLVGRDELLGTIVRAVCGQRVTWLHGDIGVGKSAVALAAADRLAEAGAFEGGVVVLSLHRFLHNQAVCDSLSQTLTDKPTLVVLDGLDHAAQRSLPTQLLGILPSAHILVTSRLAETGGLEIPSLSPGDARRFLVGSTRTTLDPEAALAFVRLIDAAPLAVKLTGWLLGKTRPEDLYKTLEASLLQMRSGATPISVLVALVRAQLSDSANRLLWALSLLPDGASADELGPLAGEEAENAVVALSEASLLVEVGGRWLVTVDLPETEAQLGFGPVAARLRLTLAFLAAGRIEMAFELSRRVLESCQKSQNRAGFAAALLTLGRITLIDDPARAVLLFEEAATHFASLGDPESVAETRLWEGRALTALKQPEAALAAFYSSRKTRPDSTLNALFDDAQRVLAAQGGGELLPVLEIDADAVREGGVMAARVQLGMPAK